MIYLIDDKKLRQEKDYNWTCNRFQQYDEFIRPIYKLSELQDKNKQVFQEGNVILYHESFIDKTHIKDEAVERRQNLQEFISKKNSYLVLFSGSKNTRDLTENIANIPVSVLYSNLESFIKKFSTGDVNLRYLLFGDNPEIEEELSKKLDSELFKTTQEQTYTTTSNNLFIRPDEKYINQPLSNYVVKTFFDNVTDQDFSEALVQWMNEDVYENIFIPLCFGSTLSDYNGLRLACHIRCTKTKNQTTRIFIYGIVSLEYLMQNDYFNILKTKNTFLIPFSKKAIFESIQKPQVTLLNVELPFEIAKLNLDPPKNYEDSHSIANEWAIYRWANTIDAEDEDIRKITGKVSNDLYFKYLQTIFPFSDSQKIEVASLKIKKSGRPKVLYIDDEADKGWYEIFCKIIYDINAIDFSYLGNELKSKTREEIIQLSFDKIKIENSDVVILDFRLHPDDFSEKDLYNVTGLQLLKRIKEHNPGIQVIIFSATNKVWNLQALQDAGADGFIIKESPENNKVSNFTLQAIDNFISVLDNCFGKTFLKDFYVNLEILKKELIPRKNYKKSVDPLPKEFVDEVLLWLELSYNLLGKEVSNTNLSASFLFMFSVLENLSNRIIDVDNPIEIEGKPSKFKFEFRFDKRRLKRFIEDESNLGYYRRTKAILESNRNLPWAYKILNTLDFITDEKLAEKELGILIKKRNDLIHANSTTGEKFEINVELLKLLNNIIIKGLTNVK